jgi:crossover junction endodeoxyribonuclease RuvC
MIILGVDPGTASTGWGVVERTGNRLACLGHGCIVTSPKDETGRRLCRIRDELSDVLRRFAPEAVAVEDLFVNVNARTALTVGHARGVVILTAADNGLPSFDYTPTAIKQAVTGYGRASKGQVQEMTRVLLGLAGVPHPDHAADALAVAITHAHVYRSQEAARRAGAPR